MVNRQTLWCIRLLRDRRFLDLCIYYATPISLLATTDSSTFL